MKYSPLVTRISGASVSAWDIHYAACAAQSRGEDVLVLSIGDPDFATDAAICEAAISALHAGDTHYTPVTGRMQLREAIAAKQQALSGIRLSAEQVSLVAGAQNGLYASAMCLFQAGDEVLVPEPMYLTYAASIQASGATLVPIAQPSSGDFRLTAEALAEVLTPRTRGIALATPNNPTGNVYRMDELAAVAAVAREHDLWVLSDEVYAQLTYEQPHQSIAALPGMAERTVLINSLSKSHAMTGWRVGWVAGPREFIDHMENLLLCMLYGLPGFIQSAALKALALDQQVVGQARQLFQNRRDLVVAALADVPLLKCKVPEAGMFMLLDVRATGLSSQQFAWGLYAHGGVAVLDAEAFGGSCRGFVRLSFTVSDAQLQEACRRIAAYVATLPAGHG